MGPRLHPKLKRLHGIRRELLRASLIGNGGRARDPLGYLKPGQLSPRDLPAGLFLAFPARP